MNDLERIIEKTAIVTCIPPCYLDRQIIKPEDLNLKIYNLHEIAQAIIDAGYIKKSEIGVDEEKLEAILWENHNIFAPTRFDWCKENIKGLSHEIAQNIQSLITKKEEV